jgi:hypothetical protein
MRNNVNRFHHSFASMITDLISDLVWSSISGSLEQLVSTWWEQPHTVDLLNAFRRVCLFGSRLG